MDPSDRMDAPTNMIERPALFNEGRHYPVEDDAWQWVKPVQPDYKPCPCSDHIFKIAKKQFHVVPIASAWEYISQLGKDEIMNAFTAIDCDTIRAGRIAFGCSINKDHIARAYRTKDYEQLTRDSPVFVLAAYSPYAGGRTLQCTHDHDRVECNIYQLIRDYSHNAQLRAAFAKAIAPDTFIPGVAHIPGAVDTMVEFIQRSDTITRFINLGFPLKPIHICDIVRICARVVQDELMRARLDPNCIWWLVPKDIIKIIHRMVFDNYPTATRSARAFHNWLTIPDIDHGYIRPFGNNAPDDDGYESPLELDLFG
jgi:hypothetical protein